jgi:ABC-type Mn2+/Zn2+ transport system ATPase subunit
LGGNRASDLPKKVLFARRHFSSSVDHEPVHFSNLDDQELVSNQIPDPSVKVFRLGEIEQHAGATRLRSLFDTICGPEVEENDRAIAEKTKELAAQRQAMVDLAARLAALTATDAPLRDYIHRRELLAAVDQPEVKEAYERIDQIEKAEKTALAAGNEWEEIETAFDLDRNVAATREFFAKYRAEAMSDKDEPRPDHEALLEIVKEDAAEAEGPGGHLNAIKGAADTLNSELKAIGEGLSAFHTNVESAARGAREALQKRGLPTGGKDREAKKKAFDEAQEALDQYRALIRQWREAESARQAMVQKLSDLAERRSELRDKTAREITDKLKRDLDKDILIIEANARIQSDMREFREWLIKHFSDQAFRYRDRRIDSLLENGLRLADLRAFLTNVSPNDYSLLVVEGTASDGGIDTANARALYDRCAAISQLSPEKQKSEVEGTIWNECPQEVRDGLLEFPRRADGDLCVDSVLKLDEILLDDEPVILLNDRPHDSDSTLRPLEELSPGQRCSAILPILLLTGEGPLIIDQPEDNLDNRLIRQVIVNILASIKLRRQVIVATHNPNVPVLGDVENAVVLRGVKDRECVVDAVGDLDASDVVHQITRVMEGGREAFQYRQTIYQLHWAESVAHSESE